MLLYKQIIRESTNLSEDWMIVVFIIQLILLAWMSLNYPKRIKSVFLSVLKRDVEKRDFNEEQDWTNTYSLAFMTFFFLSISWLGFLIIKEYDLVDIKEWNASLLFTLIFLGFILLYFLKLLLLNGISAMSTDEYSTGLYAFTISRHYQITGIILMPLVLIMSYNPFLNHTSYLFVGVLIYAIIYIIRLIRGLLNSYESGARPFYLILYLCTFEFLPLLLIIKLVN